MIQQEPAVSEVMVKLVMSVDLKTTVKDCAKKMTKQGVSCAVITQSDRPVGIVTERDLVSKVLADAVDPENVLVSDIMSTPLITVQPTASITVAAGLMAEYRVRRLIVIDPTGPMVGIITSGDIARWLAESHGYKEATLNAMARYKEGVEGGPYQ